MAIKMGDIVYYNLVTPGWDTEDSHQDASYQQFPAIVMAVHYYEDVPGAQSSPPMLDLWVFHRADSLSKYKAGVKQGGEDNTYTVPA